MDKLLNVIRGLIRPYLAFIFPTAVIVIGIIVSLKLLPIAIKYIDRDISLIIITALLTMITAIVTTAAIIMAFYFGERKANK